MKSEIQASFYFLDRKILLDKSRTYQLGRTEENDVQLNEKTVSRSHAKISFIQNSWTITDLNSTNGTLVNYIRIDKKTLTDGDRVMIGPFHCIYSEKSDSGEMDELVSDSLLLERKIQEIFSLFGNEEEKARLYDLKHFINSIRRRMDKLANKDRLTGLYNRGYFDHQLTLELERSRRYHQDVYLIMVDIDHFKKFNDTHGHQKGDEVLAAVAAIMEECTRQNDIVCRYGGEEMAVILPMCSPNSASSVGEKIRQNVETLSVKRTGLKVTISVGVASGMASGFSLEKLIKRADTALYQAKDKGRNCVVSI